MSRPSRGRGTGPPRRHRSTSRELEDEVEWPPKRTSSAPRCRPRSPCGAANASRGPSAHAARASGSTPTRSTANRWCGDAMASPRRSCWRVLGLLVVALIVFLLPTLLAGGGGGQTRQCTDSHRPTGSRRPTATRSVVLATPSAAPSPSSQAGADQDLSRPQWRYPQPHRAKAGCRCQDAPVHQRHQEPEPAVGGAAAPDPAAGLRLRARLANAHAHAGAREYGRARHHGVARSFRGASASAARS